MLHPGSTGERQRRILKLRLPSSKPFVPRTNRYFPIVGWRQLQDRSFFSAAEKRRPASPLQIMGSE